MELTEIILLSSLIAFIYFSILYIWALVIKDSSIVDIGWGLGFVAIAWAQYLLGDLSGVGHLLICVLVTVWGVRLALHIFMRKKGKPEDWRYAQWRKDWGKTYVIRSFFQIFMLQGLMMVIISTPIAVAAFNEEFPVDSLVLIGLLVWVIGFFFEAAGDYQLSRFLKQPKNKGKIMKYGVWRYTRHPNYFGEVVVWWALFLMVAGLSSGWIAVVSPLTITFLLLKVSGIPMLEKKYKDNKEFQAYKKVTPAFLPWFPKK